MSVDNLLCLLYSPIEGPVEQEDLGSFWQGYRVVLVGLQGLGYNTIQPARPLLQGVLLLQCHFKVLLQPLDHTVLTLAHPGCLLLRRDTGRQSHGSVVFHFKMHIQKHSQALDQKD